MLLSNIFIIFVIKIINEKMKKMLYPILIIMIIYNLTYKNIKKLLKIKNPTLVDRAKKYGSKLHKSVNHKYDYNNYSHHLEMVYNNAVKFKYLLKNNINNILAACWLHDTIEDCRVTYNDIKFEFNENIAELVFALSNEKGKIRKDRANDKYYNDMKLVEGAVFIKICDRIANIQYSKSVNSSMFEKYKQEHANFKKLLYSKEYDDMFNFIETLIK